MTDQEQAEERKRFELQARRDLQDIRDLRSNAAFQRYFMRRLMQVRNEVADRYHNDPLDKTVMVKQFEGDKEGLPVKVEVCGHEEREILRRLLLELNKLCGLLDDDESSAKVSVDRLHQ